MLGEYSGIPQTQLSDKEKARQRGAAWTVSANSLMLSKIITIPILEQVGGGLPTNTRRELIAERTRESLGLTFPRRKQ